MCVESSVLFRFAHLSLTRSKYPCWPPTHTQTHRHPPPPLHTGWPDYRARENHLQQRLNYIQTSASCWPLLGRDCLLQVTTFTHIFNTAGAGWCWTACCFWSYLCRYENFMKTQHEVKTSSHQCATEYDRQSGPSSLVSLADCLVFPIMASVALNTCVISLCFLTPSSVSSSCLSSLRVCPWGPTTRRHTLTRTWTTPATSPTTLELCPPWPTSSWR